MSAFSLRIFNADNGEICYSPHASGRKIRTEERNGLFEREKPALRRKSARRLSVGLGPGGAQMALEYPMVAKCAPRLVQESE